MENNSAYGAATRSQAPASKVISKPLQLATIFLLGLVMLFGAGFVQTSAVHNAAHDVRHSLAFPCH